MIDTAGWLKLHRKLNEWEWIDDPPTFCLFIHCLLNANRKPSKYRGYVIPKGGFVTSHHSLSNKTGLSIQQIRTAIKKLIKSGVLTSKSTSKFSIITITNWQSYQHDQQSNNKRPTNDQQTTNKRLTTEEEDNNKRNKEYIYTDYFEKFWLAYPKRKGSNPKKPAAEKFKRLVKNGVSPDEIIRGAINYERQEKDLGNLETPYVAQAVTWLNQERWKEPEPNRRNKNGYQGM